MDLHTFQNRNKQARLTPKERGSKQTVLTIHDKLEIIRRIENGEKQYRIAKEYGIARSTVSDIKNMRAKFQLFLSKNHSPDVLQHRTMRLPKDILHEQAVYHWYLEQVNTGNRMSNAVLLAQAKVIHQDLHGNEPGYDPNVYQMTTGWLTRFKSRHGIVIS